MLVYFVYAFGFSARPRAGRSRGPRCAVMHRQTPGSSSPRRSCSRSPSGEASSSSATAPAGRGPEPDRRPSGQELQVQVIGQQWNWTYRFPGYGGVETPSSNCRGGRPSSTSPRSTSRTPSGPSSWREGRCGAGRGQHRVRQAESWDILHPLRRAVRALARAHATTATWSAAARSAAGSRGSRRRRHGPGSPAAYSRHYFPEPRGGPARGPATQCVAVGLRLNLLTAIALGTAASSSAPMSAVRSPGQGLPDRDRPERHRRVHGFLFATIGGSPASASSTTPSHACSAARPATRSSRGRCRPLLRVVHRPQGDRDPVLLRRRRLLPDRRAERHADPHRAPDAERGARPASQYLSLWAAQRDDDHHDARSSWVRSATTSCR